MNPGLLDILYFLIYFVVGSALFTLGVLIRSHFWTIAHFLSPDIERVKLAYEETNLGTVVGRLGSLFIMLGVLVCIYSFFYLF